MQELGSSVKGSKNLTTQTSTPKIMEEVVTKIKQLSYFKTMAIVNLNMGNLIMEVNTLKNILAIGRRRLQCY